MSTNLCLIAWNEPIGTPNCSRCFGVLERGVEDRLRGADHLERERRRSASSSARRSAGAADTSGSPSTRSRATRTPSRSTCARRRLPSSACTGVGVDRRRPARRPRARRRRRPHRRARTTTTSSSTASPSTTKRFVPESTASFAVERDRRLDVGRIERAGRFGDRERARELTGRDRAEEAGLLVGGADFADRGRELRDGRRAAGPGAITRPSSSARIASSSTPRPMPPCSSAIVSAGQPSSTIVAQSASGVRRARRPRGRATPGSPWRAPRGSSRGARLDRS